MKFRLDFQSEVDILTQGELDDSLKRANDAAARALLRAVNWRRLPRLIGQAADSALALGVQDATSGPDSGFRWSIRRLAVAGLTSGATPDTVAFYRNSPNNPAEWQVDGNFPFARFGKAEFTLDGGETLVVASVGTFASTSTVIVTGEISEVPAEMYGKLVA